MLDPDLDPRPARRNRLLGALGLILVAALGVVASDLTPPPVREGLGLAPRATGWSATQTPSSGTTREPVATPVPTPSPPPFGPPSREDHYWLERPIAPSGTDWVDYTYAYGSRGDGTLQVHRGVEFQNPQGTPVLAAGAGVVVYAGSDDDVSHGAREGYYGLLVIIELDRKLDGHPVFTLYGHLSEVTAQQGDRVETGEVVGHVGMTGIALGPHLHMEVRVGRNEFSATVNPELWLVPYEGKGTLAGVVVSPNGEPARGVDLRVTRASSPGIPIREFTSYPGREVNPDPYWGENMVCGDLDDGDWVLEAMRSGYIVSTPFTVTAGRTTWVTMRVPW